MPIFPFVRQEELDVERRQGRFVERQRAFNIAYGQDDMVDHFSFRLQTLRYPISGLRRMPAGTPTYLIGRAPAIRMSISLRALCCQSGLVETLATPTIARRRSIGSRPFRMSPLLTARFTRAPRAS